MYFENTLGLKIVEILDAQPDPQGRVLVRKWRAQSKCWTQPKRMYPVFKDIPSGTSAFDRRVQKAAHAAWKGAR